MADQSTAVIGNPATR